MDRGRKLGTILNLGVIGDQAVAVGRETRVLAQGLSKRAHFFVLEPWFNCSAGAGLALLRWVAVHWTRLLPASGFICDSMQLRSKAFQPQFIVVRLHLSQGKSTASCRLRKAFKRDGVETLSEIFQGLLELIFLHIRNPWSRVLLPVRTTGCCLPSVREIPAVLSKTMCSHSVYTRSCSTFLSHLGICRFCHAHLSRPRFALIERLTARVGMPVASLKPWSVWIGCALPILVTTGAVGVRLVLSSPFILV